MFERESTDPQTDNIEFDFFDDAPTTESPSREREATRRGPRLPKRPPGGGGPRGPGLPQPSLFRLGILIAGAILLAVILVLWVNSCRAGQKKAEYRDYMEAVSGPASESAQVGKRLNQLLTTPAIKLNDLRDELDGLSQQSSQILATARKLDPPGPLRDQQESLVESFEFRVNGIAGLIQAFSQVQSTKDSAEAGSALAIPAQRLVASDVVYQDLFFEGSRTVMSNEDVKGIPIPESGFVQNGDLASPSAWTLIVERLTRSPSAGGIHGNQIVGVIVQPGADQLSPTEDNTVKTSDRQSFQVLVKNSGESQETQVKVTLTIQQSPEPKRFEQTIDIINPGETKTVVFRDLGPPSFGTRTTVKVNVEPVIGETNTSNNTAEYPVIFTLG
jgi:CARDB